MSFVDKLKARKKPDAMEHEIEGAGKVWITEPDARQTFSLATKQIAASEDTNNPDNFELYVDAAVYCLVDSEGKKLFNDTKQDRDLIAKHFKNSELSDIFSKVTEMMWGVLHEDEDLKKS